MAVNDAGDSQDRAGRRKPARVGFSSERWQPRNWRLRTKMTVVVMVPALTALAFAGLRIQTELTAAGDFNRMIGQVDASMLITEVVHQLQTERGTVSSAVADGSITTPETTAGVFRQTDAAISELRDKVGILDLLDSDSKSRYNNAFNKLSQLTPLRNLAKASTYPDLAVLSAYNAMIDPMVQLGREITVANASSAQSPSRLAAAVQTIGQAKERASQLDALLMVSAVRNNFSSSTVQNQAEAAAAGFDASIAEFFAMATPDEQQEYNDGYSGAEVDKRRDFAQAALSRADPTAPLDIDLKSLRDASNAANNKLRGVETNLIASLRTQASNLADEATTTVWQVVLIVIGAMLIALVLGFLMAQSLVNPLRRLRRGALKVANVTLPTTIERILADPNPVEAAKNAVAPMPVDTSEEVGQVARSFDVVHERAVRLATEQAVLRDNVNDMFVNMSRRTQALVERQLSELDKLEQNERDPDQLAQFFVLDHLAARMRRNSENLLILSGVGVARRSSKPVPVTEVIGAAQSEIENYARVVIKGGPDTLVQGRVVNDVAHLLAELLDNATKFSAADTKVTVSSTHVRSGELAIQISDRGLGLSDDELADINGRLNDPPPFDLAVSRRMGLYVVARLAKRHDIKVRLHGEFNSGTSAVVVLPKKLTTGTPATGPQTQARMSATGPTQVAKAQPSVHSGATAAVDGDRADAAANRSNAAMQPVSRTDVATGPTAPVQDPARGTSAGMPPAAGPPSGPTQVPGSGVPSGPHAVPGSGTPSGPHAVRGSGVPSGPHAIPGSGAPSGPHAVSGSGAPSGPHAVPGSGAPSGPHAIPGSGAPSGPHAVPGSGTPSGPHAVPGSGTPSGPVQAPGSGTPSGATPGSGAPSGPTRAAGAPPGEMTVPNAGAPSGSHAVPGSGPTRAAGAPPGEMTVPNAGTPSGSHAVPGSGAPSGPMRVPGSGTPSGATPAAGSGAPSGPMQVPGSGAPSGPIPVPGNASASGPGTGTHRPADPKAGPGTGTHRPVGAETGTQPVVGPDAGTQGGADQDATQAIPQAPKKGATTGRKTGGTRKTGTGRKTPAKSAAGGQDETETIPAGTGKTEATTGPNATSAGQQPAGEQAGPSTGQQPAIPSRTEPAHAAKEGLARSPWFQRTVPANVAGPKGTGPGAKGNGKGPKDGKAAKGRAGAKSAGNGRPAGNGRMNDPNAVSASTLNWATAGEDGWSAVRRKLGETAQQAKISDPLPRRTPGSRLVPGSAGERRLTNGDGKNLEPEPPSQDKADGVRSRLEGYQQGLARGRGDDDRPEEQG